MAGAEPHATEGEGEAASARDHLCIDHVTLGESKQEGRTAKEGNVGEGKEWIEEAESRNQALLHGNQSTLPHTQSLL